MMRNCFFLHNPKAGGTSLRQSLIRQFAPEDICPAFDIVPAIYGHPNRSRLPGNYRLYIGHYGYDLARSVVTDHALITNFRHPADRIVSLYRYFRHSVPETERVATDPTYYAVRLAKEMDLASFLACDDPRVTTYTADHHFRQLCNDGWSLTTRRTFAQVAHFIERLDWLYVCEFPELSQRWGRAALDAPDLSVGRENVSLGDRRELDAGGFRRILELNPRDVEIYRLAVDRLLQETARRPRPSPRRFADAPVPARASRARFPRRGLATGLAAGLAGLAVLAHPGAGQTGVRLPAEPGASPDEVMRLRTHLAQAGTVLDRIDLVTFTRFEATHPAAASADLRRRMGGRRFAVDVPLGCGERPPRHASSSARWWYDDSTKTLRLKAVPSAWEGSPVGAPAALFWITRPKANARLCPPAIAPKVSYESLSPTRMGLVATDLAKEHAPLERPVKIAATWSDVARLAPSLRLHIEGRIDTARGGWASACRPLEGGAAPDCVLFARIERLSLRPDTPGAGPFSDWRHGGPPK